MFRYHYGYQYCADKICTLSESFIGGRVGGGVSETILLRIPRSTVSFDINGCNEVHQTSLSQVDSQAGQDVREGWWVGKGRSNDARIAGWNVRVHGQARKGRVDPGAGKPNENLIFVHQNIHEQWFQTFFWLAALLLSHRRWYLEARSAWSSWYRYKNIMICDGYLHPSPPP